MKQQVTVVILAAGLGTRMRSTKAKVLHQAGGDTLLNHVIRAALNVAAPERIIAVVGHQAQQVRESVPFGAIRFADQLEQKGTGHAVLCSRGAIESEEGLLLILNGDGPLLRPATLQRLLAQAETAPGGSIVTTEVADATGYGRIVRGPGGTVAAIVEQKAATGDLLHIREINPGVYCFRAPLFWQYVGEIGADNAANEYYLTDMVQILTEHEFPVTALRVEDETELLGINTRVELAAADKILRARKADELMLSGVTIENPESVSIDVGVEVGQDSIIEANVQLRGKTRIGPNCQIGTGSVLRDCQLANDVTILPYIVAEASSVGAGSIVGPFARLRLNTQAEERTHIGNFVELKKTRLGSGSKANHLAYLGDAVIGSNVNVGAGAITCNYDGEQKHQTTLGNGVFVGSNSTLVAPLTISDGAFVAAASVITKDVEADALAIGRARQVEKPGWAKRRRVRAKSS